MKLIPLHLMLQIEVEKEEARKSGIILSNTPKPTSLATVLSVPEDIESIKIGDKVVINQYSPLEITLNDGSKIVLINYDDVYCIIKE